MDNGRGYRLQPKQADSSYRLGARRQNVQIRPIGKDAVADTTIPEYRKALLRFSGQSLNKKAVMQGWGLHNQTQGDLMA